MTDPQPETTEHLACPWCQYDLYGLPAASNTVRCPECGNRSNLLLRIPAKERANRVRGMESLPAACSGLMLFAIIFALPNIWELLDRGLETDGKILAGLALGCGVNWVFRARAYFRRYRFVLGAFDVFVTLHVCLWLFTIGLPFTWGGACYVMSGAGTSKGLVTCFGGTAVLVFGRWLYKRARGMLREMYDQLAGADKRQSP
jgi:hypothetical protein